MTLLDALLYVRNVAAQSPEVASRKGRAALRLVDKKIAGLQRKKAFRERKPSPIVKAEFPSVVPMYSERAAREDWRS